MNVVAYYRVSTKAQGESGLGLEAQREYIAIASQQTGWNVVAEFTDHQSGNITPTERKGLREALELCRKHRFTLVVGKLDRLSRDVADIAQLMKLVDFKVATMPAADKFQLHIYAALAEQERDFIALRTRDALAGLSRRAKQGDEQATAAVERRAAALAKGSTLKAVEATKANKEKAELRAKALEDSLRACLQRGINTLQGVAECLNSKGITTERGSSFQATTVRRLMDRLSLNFS